MSMEVCGDEGGVFWWEWDDRGLHASGSSAIYATYHSTMSPDGHQFSVARADYSWLVNRNVVLCGMMKTGLVGGKQKSQAARIIKECRRWILMQKLSKNRAILLPGVLG